MFLQTDKIIRQRAHLIYLVTGTDHTGRSAYYYLMVQKSKLSSFLDAFQTPDDMELADYGTLIASGYGSMPPESVQHEIKNKYGSI